jgi:hypothetical protein
VRGRPTLRWEESHKHEVGATAIDEGYFIGTNTGSMTGPNGETIPATGMGVRARECDIATVESGVITRGCPGRCRSSVAVLGV